MIKCYLLLTSMSYTQLEMLPKLIILLFLINKIPHSHVTKQTFFQIKPPICQNIEMVTRFIFIILIKSAFLSKLCCNSLQDSIVTWTSILIITIYWLCYEKWLLSSFFIKYNYGVLGKNYSMKQIPTIQTILSLSVCGISYFL